MLPGESTTVGVNDALEAPGLYSVSPSGRNWRSLRGPPPFGILLEMLAAVMFEPDPAIELRCAVGARTPVEAQRSGQRHPETASTALLPCPGFVVLRIVLVVCAVDGCNPAAVDCLTIREHAVILLPPLVGTTPGRSDARANVLNSARSTVTAADIAFPDCVAGLQFFPLRGVP